jgi:hypothetical protein
MSTATLPAPTVLDVADDNVDHIYCCDEEVSLCGMDISGEPEVEPGTHPTCPLCVWASEACGPCGVPGCQP